MRWGSAVSVSLLFVTMGVFWAQEKPSTGSKPPSSPATATAAQAYQFIISPEDKARKNPTKSTEESVERGKSLFATQCAMCHGKSGDGKGDLAGVMHISPPDFTKPETLAKRTDGDLYAIIRMGSATMPSEASRLKEKQVWDLVNFLRTIEAKTLGKSGGPHSEKR
jgi:mono/diheme cytochrome c family protein